MGPGQDANRTEDWPDWLKYVWIFIAGLFIPAYGLGLGFRINPREGQLHDFVQEWTSARNHFEGYPIYEDLDVAVSRYFGEEFVPLLPINVNAHPPGSVLLALPTGKLSYTRAYLVWNLASLAALGLSLWLIMRPSGLGLSPWLLLPITAILLASDPLAQQVNMGQFNLFLLCLVVGAWWAARRDRNALAGVLLGVATAIKLFPGYLFLYFLFRRKWIAFVSGAFAFLVVGVGSLSVLGFEAHRHYVSEVMPQVNEFRDWWGNASLPGLFRKLFNPTSRHVAPVAQLPFLATLGTFVSVGLIVAVNARVICRARGRAESDYAFALSVLAMLLVSPITWSHYFLLLILSFLVFWKALRDSCGLQGYLVLSVLVLAANPVWLWGPTIQKSEFSPDLIKSPPGPLLALTVISYQCYALVTLFLVAVCFRPRSVQVAERAEEDGRGPSTELQGALS